MKWQLGVLQVDSELISKAVTENWIRPTMSCFKSYMIWFMYSDTIYS